MVGCARFGREHPQAVLGSRQTAQLVQGGRRNTATGSFVRDSIPDNGGAVRHVVEVEAPNDGAVAVEEDMKDAYASLLLGKELPVVLRISLEVLVTAVGDELCEVRPVCQLECEDRVQVIAMKTLKLTHTRSVVASRMRPTGHVPASDLQRAPGVEPRAALSVQVSLAAPMSSPGW